MTTKKKQLTVPKGKKEGYAEALKNLHVRLNRIDAHIVTQKMVWDEHDKDLEQRYRRIETKLDLLLAPKEPAPVAEKEWVPQIGDLVWCNGSVKEVIEHQSGDCLLKGVAGWWPDNLVRPATGSEVSAYNASRAEEEVRHLHTSWDNDGYE